MNFPDIFDDDETKCDHCGQPTPRLDPPHDIELCDSCWRAQVHADEIRANNDATYQRAIRRFFGLTREEQLQGLADRGCDTWSEYREER